MSLSKSRKSTMVEEIKVSAKIPTSSTIYLQNNFSEVNALIKAGRIDNIDYCVDKINSNDHIFYSYGNNVNKGIFYFKKGTILDKICDSKQFEYFLINYCFVEKKPEHYKLIFDVDFKETDENYNKYSDKLKEITELITDKIELALKIVFKEPNTKFIYCDKNKGQGVHLYYPDIVVNKIVHIEIYNILLKFLLKDKTFDFDENIWSKIVDVCTSKANGLRLPYFAIDGKYYKQNKKRSTYNIEEFDGYPNKNVLELCLIRTNKTECYPELKINIYEEKDEKLKKIPKKLIKPKIQKEEKILVKSQSGKNKGLTFKTTSKINKISIACLDDLLSCIDIQRFLKVDSWLVLKFVIFNCNNSLEACNLFYKYGRTGKYQDVSYQEIETSFIKTKEDPNFDVNILRCYARKDNPKKFETLKLNTVYEKKEFETIKFNREKITKTKNEKKKSIIEQKVGTFLKSNNKIFGLISPYGTGKTSFTHDTISIYNKECKRVLFVTHRQALARDVLKNYEDLGFVSYLDKKEFDIDKDRLIVNIDSLKQLIEFKSFYFGEIAIKEFDLIVLDEICSLLNHFESSLMKDQKEEIYNLFEKLVKSTSKVICLDGDFCNREYNYLNSLVDSEKIEVYENEFKPNKYHFEFTKNQISFMTDICKSLENGEKVVFVSMSQKKADEIDGIFKKKGISTLCITGKTDDEVKKEIVNLNEKLIKNKVQLFIYSPTITVGNDFDFDYFDKQYGYICNNSVCARDYMQMCFRVRRLKNKNMKILADNNIVMQEWANFYTLEEVKNKLCVDFGFNKNKLKPYQLLRIHNYFEDINSKNYLLPTIVHFINKKGFTYLIDKSENKKHNDCKNNEYGIKLVKRGELTDKMLDDIVNAKIVTHEEFNGLLDKQNSNISTYKDKCEVDRYFHCLIFNIKPSELDLMMLKKIYGKHKVVENYRDIINFDINDQGNTFDEILKFKKCEKVVRLIDVLGFKIIDGKIEDKLISKQELENTKNKVIEFIDDDFQILFKLKKLTMGYIKEELGKNETDNKKYLGFLNSIFNDYGFQIDTEQKKVRINNKRSSVYDYRFNISELITFIKK